MLKTVGNLAIDGVFTPVAYGSSSAGSGTYSAQTGRYTRIGNRVFFDLYIAWSAHTGTGSLRISGLPFTVNATLSSACSAVANGITLTALNYLQPLINQNSDSIFLYQYPVGGGSPTETTMDTSGGLWISGSYGV